MMSGKRKYTDYYHSDKSVDFDENVKISSQLTYTQEEVGNQIYFCNISCAC
jgi:hypothetical protein